MPSIHKDKNGKRYVKYWNNGKSTTKRGFKTKAEAKTFINELQDKEVDTCFIHFRDMAEEYRKEYHEKRVKPGTYMRTTVFFEKYIYPNFPNKSMNSITPKDCLTFYNFIGSLDKSTGYKNDIISAFKGVFIYAYKFHQLLRDPTICLERYKKTTQELMKSQNKELQIWSVDEFNMFIAKVKNIMYRIMFYILFMLGLRKGELFALTWEDISDHKLRINKSLTRKSKDGPYEIKEPKNVHSIRTLSIPDILYDKLMLYKQSESETPGFSEKWFVFGRNKPVAENTFTRVKDRAVKESGVKMINIHDLRHSCASLLIGRNINIVSVSRMLGHADIETTLKTYAHLIKENEDILLNEINKINQSIEEKYINRESKEGGIEILNRSKHSQNILKNNQAKRKALA